MREEETQVSRLLSIQVCDIPLSLIPFSDIGEVKKYTRSVLFFFNNIYLVTTRLMTILTFTWREHKSNVKEINEKYNVTAFTTNEA